MTLIGEHELHEEIKGHVSNLFADGLLSLLAYLTVSHTHSIARIKPMKFWLLGNGKQL